MPTVIIHIQNEESVMGEVDQLPGSNDNLLMVKNPRRKDGRELDYIEPDTDTVLWPLTRVNIIEVVGAGEGEKIISFVREE
jgi:hypothetical protein